MKLKLFIVGMLMLSLVVLSGCELRWNKVVDKGCFEEIALKFCEEKDCVVNDVDPGNTFFGSVRPVMYVYIGEWRDSQSVYFTEKEKESCEVQNNEIEN